MEQRKNLCAQIPLSLHAQVTEAKEQLGQTTSEYVTSLLTEYYEMKKDGGNKTMAANTRTMAFQISEDLFQRIKAHLDRESARLGRKVTQREFVLGLIEGALNMAEPMDVSLPVSPWQTKTSPSTRRRCKAHVGQHVGRVRHN